MNCPKWVAFFRSLYSILMHIWKEQPWSQLTGSMLEWVKTHICVNSQVNVDASYHGQRSWSLLLLLQIHYKKHYYCWLLLKTQLMLFCLLSPQSLQFLQQLLFKLLLTTNFWHSELVINLPTWSNFSSCFWTNNGICDHKASNTIVHKTYPKSLCFGKSARENGKIHTKNNNSCPDVHQRPHVGQEWSLYSHLHLHQAGKCLPKTSWWCLLYTENAANKCYSIHCYKHSCCLIAQHCCVQNHRNNHDWIFQCHPRPVIKKEN